MIRPWSRDTVTLLLQVDPFAGPRQRESEQTSNLSGHLKIFYDCEPKARTFKIT